MANPNPNLENLAKGRGKKPKLGHKAFSVKLAPNEKEVLEEIAKSYHCTYARKGSISGLLSKIAQQELMVVPAPPQTQFTHEIVPDPIQQDLDKDLLNTFEVHKNETSNLYNQAQT